MHMTRNALSRVEYLTFLLPPRVAVTDLLTRLARAGLPGEPTGKCRIVPETPCGPLVEHEIHFGPDALGRYEDAVAADTGLRRFLLDHPETLACGIGAFADGGAAFAALFERIAVLRGLGNPVAVLLDGGDPGFFA
jgi:hypothetical protein